eukprot:275016_1
MALGYWTRFFAGVVAAVSIFLYIVHNATPYLKLECVAFNINCPVAKSYGTIHDDKNTNSIYLQPLKQLMQQWIRNGYSTGTQLSVFINNKEKLNIFARDDVRYPKLDHNSLFPVFSTTKNFAAMLIGVAVQNKWIKSYNDPVINYWPQFPTKRLIIPIDNWLQFFNKYSSNKTHYNMKTLAQFCNQQGIKIDTKPYKVSIANVLRHEGGFPIILSNKKNEIFMETTTHKHIKTMIENTEYLIYFSETNRSYHAVYIGYILNQIFINVEPKHRSMSVYYQQEISPKLCEKVGDQEYFLSFDGLKNNAKDIDRIYHIIQQPVYWSFYHVLMPIYLGFDTPFTDLFSKQMCPDTVMDKSLCSKQSLKSTKWLMDKMGKIPTGNYPEWADFSGPSILSKTFMGNMSMEHMGVSGISNGYSIAKTVSYILFSGNVIDENVLNDMVSDRVNKFDMLLGDNSSFVKGGFHYFNVQGVDWFSWAGWGGSFMAFTPKYKCVIGFTVSAFNSPHYTHFELPRRNIIMNLVTTQLLKDNANK